MNWRRRSQVAAALGLVMAVLTLMTVALAGFGGVARAQEESHPAHIHSGTCDQLGQIVYPLSSVSAMDIEGTPMAGGRQVGQTEDIYPVDVSVTTVKAKLSDLVAGKYAINVHESMDKIQNYIACGNIGGTMFGNDLVIGLEQRNNSGYTGVALLHGNGDTTTVTVYLAEGLAGEAEKSGEATAPATGTTASAPAAQSAAAAKVDIKGFAFAPGNISVPVGTTVTWTNDDSVAHTVTANDGSFQSGNLDAGKSFSFTFNKPGTYTYHCEYHANMVATVTVK